MAQEAGWQDRDAAVHGSASGQAFVYSGYWGKPVWSDQLPDYEKQAYGFPIGGAPANGQGASGNFVGWDQQGSNGIWTNKKTGERSWNPGSGGGGGGFVGGPQQGGASSGFSGSQSYTNGGMGDTAYQQAASNAVAQMYNRIRSRKQTSVNTDMARRGISSSGVAGGIMGDAMHELDLNETADIAKIWQQNNGGGGSGSSSSSGGGDPRAGAMGPGNMGGFGSRLPGFNPAPGGPREESPNDGGRGTAFGNTWGPASGNFANFPQTDPYRDKNGNLRPGWVR